MEYHLKESGTMVPSTPQRTFHCLLNSGNSNTLLSVHCTPRQMVLLRKKLVQTVKNLLTKAKQNRRDPYLGLLEYRNTPIDDVDSTAQLLMTSRRLRSIIPTTGQRKVAALSPLDPHKVKGKLRLKQEKQKYYFD